MPATNPETRINITVPRPTHRRSQIAATILGQSLGDFATEALESKITRDPKLDSEVNAIINRKPARKLASA